MPSDTTNPLPPGRAWLGCFPGDLVYLKVTRAYRDRWAAAKHTDPRLQHDILGRLDGLLATSATRTPAIVTSAGTPLGRIPDDCCVPFFDDEMFTLQVVAPELGSTDPITVSPADLDLPVIAAPEFLVELSEALWRAQKGRPPGSIRRLAETLAAEHGLSLGGHQTVRAQRGPLQQPVTRETFALPDDFWGEPGTATGVPVEVSAS